jgi:asparagine synthase (glutamine-hydrolysing)
MSGICGVLHGDGRPAAPEDLSGMLARLAARGPEGSGAWHEGPVALGHTLLATTPEAQVERMPLHHTPSGCVITGDIRIDNRAELLAALGLDSARRSIGDGEVVMHAYLKWGTDCLDHLLGDFAFALWDATRGRLLCARDQAGMRQLIYHHAPGRLFAFASDAEALLAHPQVPAAISEARIADFLENLEAYDLTSTFYRDCQRLPPAHALMIEAEGLRIWRYWAPALPAPLRLGSDAAYAEAFREVFTEAVSACLRAPPGKLGAMLSGGMDSGSAAAVASRLLQQAGAAPLPTFSAISDAPDCIETRTIRIAQTMPHLEPHNIAIEDFPAFAEELMRLSQASGEPFDGHMAMLRAVYLAAHRAGITVMLDGAAGDTTLMADDMVAWRLRRGDILGAWREAAGGERFWGKEMPALRSFIAGARHVIVPDGLRALRRQARTAAQERIKAHTSPLAPAFAAAVDMPARRAAHARHVALRLDGRCQDRRALVTHPYVTVARERYDRVAAPLGIEPRDPFLDRRLLDFCLSLPPDQVERDGWPKIILRRAMKGLLPDAVRWRVGKEHIGWRFEEAMVAYWLAEAHNGLAPELERFVRPALLKHYGSTLPREFAVATTKAVGYLEWWICGNGMRRFPDGV